MASSIDNLAELQVVDFMSSDVISLPASATMEEAASAFAVHDIRGAPVIDELGHCIGVLSTADFARVDASTALGGVRHQRADEFVLTDCDGRKALHIEHVARDCVRQHMNNAPQTIDGKHTLIDAARRMCSLHVHRLVVLDENCRPIGVLSTHDLLAALVNSADRSVDKSSADTN